MSEQDRGPAKRRGRPPKFGDERTRGSLTVRLRDRVRSELEKAATSGGRSLSEEMEFALELALARKDQLTQEWGEDLMKIATALAGSLSYIEASYGKHWYEDDKATEAFKLTAAQIIQNYRDRIFNERRDPPAGVAALNDLPPDEQAEHFARLGGLPPPRTRRKPVGWLVAEDQAEPS